MVRMGTMMRKMKERLLSTYSKLAEPALRQITMV